MKPPTLRLPIRNRLPYLSMVIHVNTSKLLHDNTSKNTNKPTLKSLYAPQKRKHANLNIT
jgi:hypothetical protein